MRSADSCSSVWSHDRTMRVVSRSVVIGQPPAPLSLASRRLLPREDCASRNEVGNSPYRAEGRRSRRSARAAGRGSGAKPPPCDGRWRAAGSRAPTRRDQRSARNRPRPVARQPAGRGDWVPSGVACGSRRSRREPGAGTTTPQSGLGREVGEGPARCSAVLVALHLRQGSGRAGSGVRRKVPISDSGGKFGKGRLVSPLSLNHQIRIHCPIPRTAPTGGAAHTVWGGARARPSKRRGNWRPRQDLNLRPAA